MSYLDREGLVYLWQKIKTSLTGKQNALIGQLGQVVGFDASGNAVPVQRWSNPNLLDNAYFIGGGSQQDGGQFPINQRGKTEYSTDGYTIDRWREYYATISLVAAGVNIIRKFSTEESTLAQSIKDQFLYGKRLTFSVLLADGNLHSGSVTIPESWQTSFTWQKLIFFETESFYAFAQNPSDGPLINIVINGIEESITIAAAKLELGTVQTLAHQDADGNWVLNDPPPNFAEEVLKCQRYFIRLKSIFGKYIQLTALSNNTTDLYSTIYIPTQMRVKPAITFSGGEKFVCWNPGKESWGSTTHNITNVTLDQLKTNSVELEFKSTNLTTGIPYFIQTSSGYIDFNADL